MKKTEIIKLLEKGVKPKEITEKTNTYYSYVMSIKKEWLMGKKIKSLELENK